MKFGTIPQNSIFRVQAQMQIARPVSKIKTFRSEHRRRRLSHRSIIAA
jgi:hypothetical protein